MENYSHIELTQEEIDDLLLQGRREKHFRLERQKYHEVISKPKEYEVLTSEKLFTIALERLQQITGVFVFDNFTIELLTFLAQYFTNDAKFEKNGYSLKKSIMLLGPLGCGKTSIMKVFAINSHNGYIIKTCREITDLYAQTQKGNNSQEDTGFGAIQTYSNIISCYPEQNYGQPFLGCCFDDLGIETTRKHFGNESNVISEIILNRYENAHLRNKTHFTGNLTTDQIGEFYGERVKSRLREMCNVITFSTDAQDRRK